MIKKDVGKGWIQFFHIDKITKPVVTISHIGRWVFRKEIADQFKIMKVTSIQLFFNKERGLLGIKPCADLDEGAYRLVVGYKEMEIWQAVGKLGIKLKGTKMFELKKDVRMGMLVMDVSQHV